MCYTKVEMKILFFLLISFFTVNPVFAQEAPIENAPEAKYSRPIILQTDLEETVANEIIVCREMPKKLGLVTEDEIVTHEITTDTHGEAVLGVSTITEKIFTCSKKTITTPDYCWYFPYSTASFEIYEEDAKNEPLYIIGIKSPDTCNKEFSEAELKDGIATLLPQGTAAPYTNKNAYPEPPAVLDPTQNQTEQINEELTFWQWLIAKIKSIFR